MDHGAGEDALTYVNGQQEQQKNLQKGLSVRGRSQAAVWGPRHDLLDIGKGRRVTAGLQAEIEMNEIE
jgi:hypothetical protein